LIFQFCPDTVKISSEVGRGVSHLDVMGVAALLAIFARWTLPTQKL